MHSTVIIRALPLGSNGAIDCTNRSAFGIGTTLMFTNGETTESGVLKFYHVNIKAEAKRELLWTPNVTGSTEIEIPDLDMSGTLTVKDNVLSFNGTQYRITHDLFDDYVFVKVIEMAGKDEVIVDLTEGGENDNVGLIEIRWSV